MDNRAGGLDGIVGAQGFEVIAIRGVPRSNQQRSQGQLRWQKQQAMLH
jgi:hypothetical protein